MFSLTVPRKFYETAYKYCVKWLPLDEVFYENCTFVDFAKRQFIDFEQIVSVIKRFPTLNAKFHNDPYGCQKKTLKK